MQTWTKVYISKVNSSLPFSIVVVFLRGKHTDNHGMLWLGRSWGHIPCTSLLKRYMLWNLGSSSLELSLLWFLCMFKFLKWTWRDSKMCRCDWEVLLLINLIACSWKPAAFIKTFFSFRFWSTVLNKMLYLNIFRKMLLINQIRMQSKPSRCLGLILVLLLVLFYLNFGISLLRIAIFPCHH